MSSFLQDLRHGLRGFLKSPGFSAVAVITLALGIGANTAIFSVVNAVVFRALPYEQPQRLVRAHWQWNKGETSNVTNSQFAFWSEHSRSFAGASLQTGGYGGFNLAGGAEPTRVAGLSVDRNFLPLLGVQPALGRNFSREEDLPKGPRVMLITHKLWRGYYGRDPAVVGKRAILDGLDYTIVGVLPASFNFDGVEDILVPIQMIADPRDQGHNAQMIARLAPGVSLRQAQAEMEQLLPRFREALPNHIGPKERGIRLVPLQEALVGDSRDLLLMLLAAVGFVLLIACANIASLLLARASGRAGELAIRASLGASRSRLVFHLMAENLVLAFAGGAAGYLVAMWALPLLLAATPEGLPRLGEVQLDLQAAAFTFVVSLLTSVLFGAAPAWRATRLDLHDVLKTSSSKLSAGRRVFNLRSGLVVAEVALALMLLVGAGLFLRSFAELNSVSPGFDLRNLSALQLSLTSERYRSTAQSWTFQQQLMERIRAIPGVEAVATVPGLPLERGLNNYITVPNRPEPTGRSVELRTVSPDYFRTLGIRVLQGRAINESDQQPGAKIVVINETLAKLFWDKENPLGKVVEMGDGQPWQIAGVVADIREIGLAYKPRPTVYLHAAQVSDGLTRATNSWFFASWLIRTRGPVDLQAALRGAVHQLDPLLPVARIRTMEQVMGASLATERFLLTLMSIFAGLALTLTFVGIFSVLSYQVTQRTQEIGIRMALGASRSEVLRMVMRQGLLLAIFGLGIGTAGAVAASRIVKSLLFQVKPTDPVTYVAVAGLLLLVAAVACWLPARRATRVDPMIALRYE